MGGDDFIAYVGVHWHLGAVFAWAFDFIFCCRCTLVDAEARIWGGVVDLCRAGCVADFVSGV